MNEYTCVLFCRNILHVGQEKCLIWTNNMKTDITTHGTWDCLRVNEVWSIDVPSYHIHNAWYPMNYIQWLDWTIADGLTQLQCNPLFRLLFIDWIWMWWVGGSHIVNFWAIWRVCSNKTHVAADTKYILPAAHTLNSEGFGSESCEPNPLLHCVGKWRKCGFLDFHPT